jgi:hypothetical protein
VKGNHVEEIVLDVLEKAIAIEVKWVTCLMQESVNCKGFVSVNFLILILLLIW